MDENRLGRLRPFPSPTWDGRVEAALNGQPPPGTPDFAGMMGFGGGYPFKASRTCAKIRIICNGLLDVSGFGFFRSPTWDGRVEAALNR